MKLGVLWGKKGGIFEGICNRCRYNWGIVNKIGAIDGRSTLKDGKRKEKFFFCGQGKRIE